MAAQMDRRGHGRIDRTLVQGTSDKQNLSS
jgi:hypothetical protein